MEDLTEDENVQHLLEEAEKAMRLYAQVKDDPATANDVKAVLDNLFRDLGRTVYNLYWTEPDLPVSQQAVEMAEITSELETEAIALEPRIIPSDMARDRIGGASVPSVPVVADKEVPEFDDDYLLRSSDSGAVVEAPREAEDEGWYTNEVPMPDSDKPLFTPEDGLEEDIPEVDTPDP